jgi:predicted DNA-binding protein (MmcQ/YjbR family)
MPAPLDRLRAICLALPEATEKLAWGHPTFRVKDKIFATASDEGRPSACFKAPPGVQQMLVEAAPERFFVPAYVGHKGWVSIWIDGNPDWEEVAGLARRSYSLIAPKRLAAKVGPIR